MKKREIVAWTTTPDGKRMTLVEHDQDYYIEVEGEALMSTRDPGSEKSLAELAVAELAGNSCPRVLIGGLGLGFTLGAALAALPRKATVVVVEFSQAIVEWNQKYDFGTAGLLDDRRVTMVVADVVSYLRQVTPEQAFDAILLDVDNGPNAWCLESNSRLYSRSGLLRIQRALRPAGMLAIWSAGRAPSFEEQLATVGFEARSESVRSRGRKGQRHTIFLARAPRHPPVWPQRGSGAPPRVKSSSRKSRRR